MNPLWEESEFVFGDLKTAAQFIHQDNPEAAHAFLEAAYVGAYASRFTR